MPNIKDFTDALTALTAPVAGDLIYVRNAAGNRKMTAQNLLNGIGSLAIKTGNGGDIGGYLMDGVNDYITVPDDANLDMGTNPFTIEVLTNGAIGAANVEVISKKEVGNGFVVYITNTGTALNIYNYANATAYALATITNQTHHIVIILNGTTATAYIDGIAQTPVTIAQFDISNSGNFVIGNDGGSYYNGKISLVRLYNRVLTATEIAAIYNNGRPDLYSLVYSERNANNTSLTSGTLTIGKRYRLKDFIAGDNFTNVGAASNADGVEFVATGTTPTTWTNSSQVIPIGCVAEYLPQNAGSLGWIESSGNQLSGSTSGSPLCINKENRPPHYRDIRKAIAANTNTTLTSIVPRGYKIVSIRAKGSDSLADIKIGSASAGEQIVAATTTSSTTPKLLTLAATANDAYSESADVTLYARHDTSASGKTMDLIFHFEKVGN